MATSRPDGSEVFISYAGPDRDVAATLAAELATIDVATSWDGTLEPNRPFEQQIQEMLADARLIVAILSPHSLSSEWVRWELSQAGTNGLHIVPLLVNGAQTMELPPPLNLRPSLTLAHQNDGHAVRGAALRIRDLVTTIRRSHTEAKQHDARRRLASAAARTARQAADIKWRKSPGAVRAPIAVTGGQPPSDPAMPANRYSASDGLAEFLTKHRAAIGFTSFQTGELFLLGRTAAGELTVDVQGFRKPTGLHVAGGSLLLATLSHIYRLENVLRSGQRLDDLYSHCYVPRIGHLTGVIDAHDIAQTRHGDPIFVATRFNCVATVSSVHSFTPIWHPSFISEIVAEDRCHLNGLATRDGTAAYVTAVARSDAYDGWRDQLAGGGIVIDVRTQEIVCDGLSMPHSPRVHGNRLWLLNSGAGELGYVETTGRASARFQPVASGPGFARGLTFLGAFALVGLSRPRYDDHFAGLGLEARLARDDRAAWCGVQIIDTASGDCVHWFRIDGPTREIYDVVVLPQVACPRSVSAADEEAMEFITIDQG